MTKHALIHHFRRAVLDTKSHIQYNQRGKTRKGDYTMLYIDTLSSFFILCIAIRNMWSERMSLKAFIMLYMLLLFAGMPVILLSCIPYGLFGILAVVCIYALTAYRNTAYQNICLGIDGFVLAVIIDDLLAGFLNMLFP